MTILSVLIYMEVYNKQEYKKFGEIFTLWIEWR